MDTAAPSRVTIERRPEGLVVTMPVPRSGCTTAFLGVWLLGWAAGEIGVSGTLIEGIGHFTVDIAFTVVWLTVWTFAGAAASSLFALMLAGREIVTLAPDGLRRRVEAFGVGVTRTYVPAQVEDLRVMPASRGTGAFFGFEYGGKTLRWGSGLTQDDAERIVAALLEYGSQRP